MKKRERTTRERQSNYPKSESGPSGVKWSVSKPLSNKGGDFPCSSVKPLAELLELCNDGQASVILLLGLKEYKKNGKDAKQKGEKKVVKK